MPVIRIATRVEAPAQRVFDLARDITLHEKSMQPYHESAVAGVTAGPIGPGEEVTWRARHLGRSWTLTSRITAFDPPRHFRDSMASGPFSHFDHDHVFEAVGAATVMKDVFDYSLPYGLLGQAADALFVRRRLRQLLAARSRAIKAAAETRPAGTNDVQSTP